MTRAVAKPNSTKSSGTKSSGRPLPAARPAAKTSPPKIAAKPLRQSERDSRKVAAADSRKVATAPAQAPQSRDAGVAAVDHTLEILDVLARLSPVATATLERETGCPSATALRLLAALEARGFAIRAQADDMWQLGPRWDVMQRAAHSQGALAAASMPFLVALARATGENIYLRARVGMEAETIAVYQADPVLRVYTEVGKRGPLHAGPARLLLAHAPEPVQTQVLSQRLPRFTPATRTDPTWIAADLQRLRARGYLITADEVNAGAASVSAPVRDASGQVIAVLILSAPSMRLRPPRPRQLLPQVLDAAAQLSRALGGPAGQTITVVPAANGGPLPGAHTASSLPTSPASPAAWVR
jgi:DNA-binding IclR family transcriptional regulator